MMIFKFKCETNLTVFRLNTEVVQLVKQGPVPTFILKLK